MEFLTTILAQQQSRGNPLLSLAPIIAMMAIFYFILIVPQKRMQKRHAAMVAGLQKGDRVVTAGGLIGEIVAVRDDEVTLKTGSTTVVVERARVTRKYGDDAPAAK